MWIIPEPLRSSVCAPAVEGSTSESASPATMFAQSVSWSGKLSPSRDWSRRCKKVSWIRRLFGLTYEPSTVARGLERWNGGHADGGLPLFPPGPSDLDRWRSVLDRDHALAPALEPPFRELADGVGADRRHWLRLLGNGVVPLQAAYAFCALWAGREVR